ncbi:GxxExxY protein [soil metagenome]
MRDVDCKAVEMASAIDTPHHLVTNRVVKAAIRVHEMTGPGTLEDPFKLALAIEMGEAGLVFRRDVWLPLSAGAPRGPGYRLDFIVETVVVVEIKAVVELAAAHRAHMLECLKLSGCPVGLLLNFNVASMPAGIRRVLSSVALGRKYM